MSVREITPEVVRKISREFGYVTNSQADDIAVAIRIYSASKDKDIADVVDLVLNQNDSEEMAEGHHP